MTTAPNKDLDQSTSNLATALRARETITDKDKWCTGYRYLRGRMCLVGHIQQALGYELRSVHFADPSEQNYVYNEEKAPQLNAILHALGFENTGDAESFNDDCRNGHQAVLERFDEGLKNWKDQ